MGVIKQIKKKIVDSKNNKLLHENGKIMYELAKIVKHLNELRIDKEYYHNKISYIEEAELDENIRRLEIKFRSLSEEQKWLQDRVGSCKN